jgi:3-isopropylmalate/(R)-2-methylmalate dehydratase large subunit
MNITEKIIAAHAGLDRVEPGQIVHVKVDMVMANDLTGPAAIRFFEKAGAKRVFDRTKVALVQSHAVPARDVTTAGLSLTLRRFAQAQEIEHYFEVGDGGIEHALLPEVGLIAPGEVIVGADSHSTTYGALGAFATGMGSSDTGAALCLGETWLRVPETIRFNYTGKPARFFTGKDLILLTIGRIGVDGARYRALEFTGPVIEEMDVEQRQTICNMAIEAGGKSGIINPDQKTLAYVADRVTRPYQVYISDRDAAYAQVHEFDLSGIGPVVALPYSPGNIRPLAEVPREQVDQVFIGSCTNGRITDLRAAASILKGRKLAKGTRLIVIPATMNIWKQAMQEGLIEIFLEAGGVVNPATCGPCAGLHAGVLGDGEVCVSTSNRNFPGRMGHKSARVYLVNPYLAAAAAVAGYLIDPAEMAPAEGSS